MLPCFPLYHTLALRDCHHVKTHFFFFFFSFNIYYRHCSLFVSTSLKATYKWVQTFKWHRKLLPFNSVPIHWHRILLTHFLDILPLGEYNQWISTGLIFTSHGDSAMFAHKIIGFFIFKMCNCVSNCTVSMHCRVPACGWIAVHKESGKIVVHPDLMSWEKRRHLPLLNQATLPFPKTFSLEIAGITFLPKVWK